MSKSHQNLAKLSFYENHGTGQPVGHHYGGQSESQGSSLKLIQKKFFISASEKVALLIVASM